MSDDTHPTAGDEPAATPPVESGVPRFEPPEEARPTDSSTATGADEGAASVSAGTDRTPATHDADDLEAAASTEEGLNPTHGWSPASASESTPADPIPPTAASEPAPGGSDPAAAPTERIEAPPVLAPVPASIVAPGVPTSQPPTSTPQPAMAPPAVAAPVVDAPSVEPDLAAPPSIDGGGSWQEPDWVDHSSEEPMGLARHDDGASIADDDDFDEGFDDDEDDVARERRPVGVIVLAAVAAIAVGLAAAFGLLLSKEHTLNSRRAAAITVSRAFAHDVTTYDYRHLEGDFAKVLTHAAGKFQTDFTQATMASGQFVTLVKQLKATATGEVIAMGVESLSTKRANVVVIVSQTVQNTNRPVAQAQRTEGRVDLQWIKGTWKVVDFHVL